MNILYIIASSLFFLWVIRNILFWIALWQTKEYRLDRILVHLRETKQGRNIFFSPLSIIKIIGIFAYPFIIQYSNLLIGYQAFVTIVYFIIAVSVIYELLLRLTKRPVLTIKAILLLFITLISILGFYNIPLVDRFLWLLIIDKVMPFIIAFFIFAFSFPTEIVQDFIISKAAQKIRVHKGVLVIGITGSYGKSSTKEYIAQILEKKFRVLKTKGTNNTSIGVAYTILKGLRYDTEVFVVEMGAYKRGEIEQICQIVRPRIGVLTAVSDQHLSLFGSMENTMKAKYELIESLPKNGLALFNGNSQNVKSLYQGTDKEKILYVVDKKEDPNEGDIVAYNVSTNRESISFDIHIGRKQIHFTAPLLGGHNVENILPGIYIAKNLGMRYKDIQQAVEILSPLSSTMTRFTTGRGVIVVSDAFTANPQSLKAALQYMKIYRKKKILVLNPMIELGNHAKGEHYKLAKEIAKVCDYLLLTNRNYYLDIIKGIKEIKKACKVVVIEKDAEYINKIAGRGDIVLFEGREAGIVLKKYI